MEQDSFQPLKRKNPVQAVERAIQILKCYETYELLGISELSRLLGRPKSTISGLVAALEADLLLEQDPDTGKYRLGRTMFRLGSRYKQDLRGKSMPFLQKICDLTGETVNLVIPDGRNVLYIAKVESNQSIRISTTVGGSQPMYCTAVGKAILAYTAPHKAQELLGDPEYLSFTSKNIDLHKLLEQLPQIRQQGYALDLEELNAGLICVGVPILDNEHVPIAAISVSGPAFRMTNEKQKTCASLLMEASKTIERLVF